MGDFAIQSNQRSKGLDAIYNTYFKRPLKQITTSLRNGNIDLHLNDYKKAQAGAAAGASQYGAFTRE